MSRGAPQSSTMSTMLSLYRRHTPRCPHRAGGQNYTKCRCPLWCDGELGGRRFRRSVGLRDWARAVRRLEAWEKSDIQDTEDAAKPVREAVQSYLGDCRARNLAPSTVVSYTKTLEHLQSFCDPKDARYMQEISLGTLTDFRASRLVAPSTSGKELETLRAFCAFAKRRGWLPENYAKELAPPREPACPTLPYSREEVQAILGACQRLEDDNPKTRERTRQRALAFCLTMLYSGLRISDAVKLRRSTVDLETGRMLLRMMKTGVPLYLRLGPPATFALASLPWESDYFFWNGESKLSTAVGNARKTISRVLALANVKGHPHRFRDTFSVALLEKGEDLRTVQLLLGHTSIRTTEKHYAPFVRSFQRILDAATSKLDFGQTFGTFFGTQRSIRPQVIEEKALDWRKLVGVEPTCDPLTDRTPDLKSGPSTGQD